MDKCFMVPERPSIVLVYIHVPSSFECEVFSTNFVESYKKFPSGCEHRSIAVCNFRRPSTRTQGLFDSIGFKVMVRSNEGWDIGAYQDIASREDPDLLVCCGESVHFHKSGWLERISDAWINYGEGMYGLFSSFGIRPHFNTTAFACSPRFLREYTVVHSKSQRYDFEHGITPMWRHIENKGYTTKLVTWDGEYDPKDWRKPDNIMWRGDQSNCLVFCKHTDRYFSSDERTKRDWERLADGQPAVKRQASMAV